MSALATASRPRGTSIVAVSLALLAVAVTECGLALGLRLPAVAAVPLGLVLVGLASFIALAGYLLTEPLQPLATHKKQGRSMRPSRDPRPSKDPTGDPDTPIVDRSNHA